MFKNSSLYLIDLSNLNAPSLTNMVSMFDNCSELSFVNLSNLKTSVTNMNSMFSGCEKLKSIDTFNFRTSNVIDMSSMFYGCKELLFAE